MEKLSKLYKILQNKKQNTDCEYYIPTRWYQLYHNIDGSAEHNECISVEPYGFYADAVGEILSQPTEDIKTGKDNSIMFSLMIRTFSAWRHYRDGEICGGTFLKSIALLPFIKKMGVDLLYLLPVFKISDNYKKGELGSPYSIKNIMEVEPSLADPLVPEMSADEQFEAFCEAAHMLNMRVMLDFVFRTCARDCELTIKHPDWFYWIDSEKCDTISCPQIEGLGHTTVSPDNVDMLYASPEMLTFAKCFAMPPEDIDKAQEISIMPGFADTINDPQPPWTDITYYKFYFDGTENAHKFSVKNGITAPFIAQDGVKCSLFEGKEPNLQLWDYIENVIPHYIDMGIDGARIDMGHALPSKLYNRIVSAAKAKNSSFIFWSEEFSNKNAAKAKDLGGDFITGEVWGLWKDKTACRRNIPLLKAVTSELPVTAAAEMADTPRIRATLGDKEHSAAAMITTAFLPNSVMLINNGQELCEIQPMNLGLQNDENGRFMLKKDDSQYGKLAFFDKFYFDWTNDDAGYIYDIICDVSKIKRKYAELISPQNLDAGLFARRGAVQIICYRMDNTSLWVIINNAQKARSLTAILKGIPNGPDLEHCIYSVNCKGMSMKGGSAAIFVKED